MPSNLDTALSLAAAGHHVFPCHSGGTSVKRPMPGIFWGKDATNDESRIRQWWGKWPDAAPALSLGKSRLIVIDADRHGKVDGVEALGNIAAEHGWQMNDTPVVATPNDGSHWYFRLPDGEKHGNAEGALKGSGINVRGDGGYVIAPGAILADGRQYELTGDIANPPVIFEWLWKLIKSGRADETPTAQALSKPAPASRPSQDARLAAYIEQAKEAEFRSVAQCGEGGRNIEVNRAAFSLGTMAAANWISDSDVYQLLETAAVECGLVKDDGIVSVRKTIRSGLTAGRQYPRQDLPEGEYERAVAHGAAIAATLISSSDGTLHDAETGEIVDVGIPALAQDEEYDFPHALLNPGGIVSDIADWICHWTNTPVRLHAIGAALSIVGTIAGRKCYTKSQPTGTHLYIVPLAGSSVGKQHPINCIRMLLNAVTGQNTPYSTGWQNSAPKFAANLVERGSRLFIADEFADKLAGIASRNAPSYKAEIGEELRTLWGTVHMHQPNGSLTRSDITLIRPSMGIYGTSTLADFKRNLAAKEVTNGLFNRFLLLPFYKSEKPGKEIDGEIQIPEQLVSRLKKLDNCLIGISAECAIRGDTMSGTLIHVPFSDEALAMNDANKEYESEVKENADNDPVLSLYGRYAEMAKRIALITAIGRATENPSYATIERRDMQFATSLVKWSIEQFIVMVRRDMTESLVQAQFKMVLNIIRRERRIMRSSLYRSVDGRMKGRDLDDIIKMLIEGQNIGVHKEKTGPEGGRPKEEYVYRKG